MADNSLYISIIIKKIIKNCEDKTPKKEGEKYAKE